MNRLARLTISVIFAATASLATVASPVGAESKPLLGGEVADTIALVNSVPKIHQFFCSAEYCWADVSDADQPGHSLHVEFFGGAPRQEAEGSSTYSPSHPRFWDDPGTSWFFLGRVRAAGTRTSYVGVRVTDDAGGEVVRIYRRLPSGEATYVTYASTTQSSLPSQSPPSGLGGSLPVLCPLCAG